MSDTLAPFDWTQQRVFSPGCFAPGAFAAGCFSPGTWAARTELGDGAANGGITVARPSIGAPALEVS